MQITFTKIIKRRNSPGTIESVRFSGIRKTKCRKCSNNIEYLSTAGTTCVFCTNCRTAFEK